MLRWDGGITKSGRRKKELEIDIEKQRKEGQRKKRWRGTFAH